MIYKKKFDFEIELQTIHIDEVNDTIEYISFNLNTLLVDFEPYANLIISYRLHNLDREDLSWYKRINKPIKDFKINENIEIKIYINN